MVHSTPNGVLFSWDRSPGYHYYDAWTVGKSLRLQLFPVICMGRKCVTTMGTTVHYKIVHML